MGDVPTEPGDYRWREGPEWSWRCRRVGPEAGSDPLVIGADCFGGPYDIEAEGGEWGERIPGNEVLKARRELAAQCPLEGPIGALYCRHCVHKQFRVMEQDEHGFMIRRVKIEHAPDCPWLRAQED